MVHIKRILQKKKKKRRHKHSILKMKTFYPSINKTAVSFPCRTNHTKSNSRNRAAPSNSFKFSFNALS